MSSWLLLGIGLGALTSLAIVRGIRARVERKRRPRTIEMPNSHYTSQLVRDRDSRDTWRNIPLERVHEINRAEIVRLLAFIAEYGVDRLNARERAFLDRMAELNPPPADRPPARDTRPENDPLWPDPFGFQPPLGSRPGGR